MASSTLRGCQKDLERILPGHGRSSLARTTRRAVVRRIAAKDHTLKRKDSIGEPPCAPFTGPGLESSHRGYLLSPIFAGCLTLCQRHGHLGYTDQQS